MVEKEIIDDPILLKEMNFEQKLIANCTRSDSTFMSYAPDSGTWVFKVNIFLGDIDFILKGIFY